MKMKRNMNLPLMNTLSLNSIHSMEPAIATQWKGHVFVMGLTSPALLGMPRKFQVMNQHPQAHHPLDARYYSIVDEPQLS
jgi:hypothetical protein